MKKVWLIVVMCMLLAGCGKQQAVEAAHFEVQRKDLKIVLGEPAEPVLEILGTPFCYGETAGKARKGVEKSYSYTGLQLRTYPGEDGDRIKMVRFTDETIQTNEGIKIGDTADRVRACYGENAIQNNRCIISRAGETLTLLLKYNVVTEIEYTIA